MKISAQPLTRQQFAQQIGVSYSILWRKLKANSIDLSPGLIFPEDQKRICDALGIPVARE